MRPARSRPINKPFTAETGIRVNMIAADNPATPLKAQVEAGNVTGDVFDVEVCGRASACATKAR